MQSKRWSWMASCSFRHVQSTSNRTTDPAMGVCIEISPPQNYHTEFNKAFNPPWQFHVNSWTWLQACKFRTMILDVWEECVFFKMLTLADTKLWLEWNRTNSQNRITKTQESTARVKTCTRDIIRIRNHITTDLCHGDAVCSGRLPPVCTSVSRFESKWRSPWHLRLRSRSKPPRKRSCLPLLVALRASWTFPENFKLNNPASCHVSRRTKLSHTFDRGLQRPFDYRAWTERRKPGRTHTAVCHHDA